ncbi:MAG: acetolactate synthase large subunit, partial [Rhodospirillaceae bacterium]|nr:acetolactate synthase large subunit [Rhodospirillaceae bacterium]
MKASDLFVQALENEGVEYVFGLPGEENLDFLDSLSRSKIEIILVRHEQGAGFMAATYGRLTGKVGVCLATLGPGATNLVTPAAYAQLGAMPMMMITGQKPIRSSRQGRFQIVDVVQMMKPLTKSARQIVDASAVAALVHEGFRIATEERPGAVHLELPEDIAGMETDEQVFECHPAFLPDADEDALNQAVALIRSSRHPLLLIGAGANRKWICGPLSDFIEKTGIPFFSTQMGKGVVDERHPLCLGTAALSSGDYLHLVLDRADLVINIGHDVVEKPPFFMERGGKKVVHVNFTPADTDAVYFPQAEVVGDIATSVRRLAKKLGRSDGHDFSFFTKVRDAVMGHIGEGADDPRFPVIPQRLVADVRKVMPSDGIIALDNGIYKIWFARNYMAHEPNTVLLDNALATMGAGQASAMMAAMLYPERRVMAICG